MAVAFLGASDTGAAVDVTSRATNVPTGAAADVVVVAFLETWTGAVLSLAPPTGFTQKGNGGTDGCTFSSGDGQTRNYVFWKRMTGTDTGTYDFSWSNSKYATLQCMAFSGVVTSGDPFDAVAIPAVGTFGSITSMSLTLTDGNGAQVFTVYNDAGGSHTPPTGFTETAEVDCASQAYMLNGGATGSVSVSGASVSSSSSAGAWAGALLSAGGAAATSLIIPRRPRIGALLQL